MCGVEQDKHNQSPETEEKKMKQEYRHTKPIRGKDPTFEKEEIKELDSYQLKERLVDSLVEYIYHECGKGNWPTRECINEIVSKKLI